MKIKLENITKKFSDQKIFENYSLTIEASEFICIKGESGSGKTTLLNIIGAITEIDAGKRYIDNKDYSKINDYKRKKIFRDIFTFIFQNFALIEEETVYENLLLILKLKKYPKKKHHELIETGLENIGLNLELKNKKVSELSGGQKQRIAILRSILSNNSIILADEPTGSLDQDNSEKVMDLLKKENEKGKTIIVVSHSDSFDEMFSKIIKI